MSQETNQWRKRLTTSLLCPSGNVATVRRPGPDLSLKAGRVARILQPLLKANADPNIDAQLELIEKLPDDELNKLMAFARVVIVDVVMQPVLVANPKEGQLGPDDVPLNDFWFIFTWAMNGGPDMPVKLAEGETTVEAVGTFPSGQDPGSDAGEDSPTM